MDNLRRLEAKKSELDIAEEKILQSAAIRKKSGNSPLNETPPPIPSVPPPDATPSGAQRLDALIGGGPPTTSTKTNGISSKKVSFAAAEDQDDANKENVKDEKLARLEKYETDPNVSTEDKILACLFRHDGILVWIEIISIKARKSYKIFQNWLFKDISFF